jgi:GNAT superfamily N-acetyltransferase
MTLHIKKESVAGKFETLAPLLRAHWCDLATNKELMVLKPDESRYLCLEKAGVLHCLFMYNDDKLIGYSANLLGPHLHYADLICLMNDVIFVDPEFRRGGAGLKLIRATEVMGRVLGAKFITFHGKPDTVLTGVMPRIEYDVQDVVFSKAL